MKRGQKVIGEYSKADVTCSPHLADTESQKGLGVFHPEVAECRRLFV